MGVVFLFIIGIGAIIFALRNSSDNLYYKNEEIKKDKEKIKNGQAPRRTYTGYTFSGKQYERSYINGLKCETYYCKPLMSLVQGGSPASKPFRNITDEENQLKFEKNKLSEEAKGKKAIRYSDHTPIIIKEHSYFNFSDSVDLGPGYKDLKTGEIYVKKKYNIFSKEIINKQCNLDLDDKRKSSFELGKIGEVAWSDIGFDFRPSNHIEEIVIRDWEYEKNHTFKKRVEYKYRGEQIIEFYLNLQGYIVGLSDWEIYEHMKRYKHYKFYEGMEEEDRYPANEDIDRFVKYYNEERRKGNITRFGHRKVEKKPNLL